jgi:hypothetical protein
MHYLAGIARVNIKRRGSHNRIWYVLTGSGSRSYDQPMLPSYYSCGMLYIRPYNIELWSYGRGGRARAAAFRVDTGYS